jgi:hypothetical protein
MTTKKTTKKAATTTKATDKKAETNKAFAVKLSTENLEKCIAEKMSPADIAKEYDVKVNTVITKFNKMAGEKAAKEAGIEEFCMATSRTPNEPKINKFNRMYLATGWIKQAGWTADEKFIVAECNENEIIIRKVTPATK